jgi:phosphatidylserine/phosphatidylglycerophosphate/cardiolipin synthase-like enzyme
MASDDRSTDLRERIRRAASSLLGEPDRGEGPPSAVETAVELATQSLSSMLHRWRRDTGLARLVGGVSRDLLTGEGERIGLSAELGVPGRFGNSARFFVDDRLAATAPPRKGGAVVVEVDAPAPGLHGVRVEVEGTGGRRVELRGQRTIHVVGGRPVALVDSAMLLPHPDGRPPRPASLEALRRLADHFELAYFDFHLSDRYAAIEGALERHGLPRGAILVYAAEEPALRALGLDFATILASMELRRLRARGVPVTTVLSDRRLGTLPVEGVRVEAPADAAARKAPAAEAAKRAAALLEVKAESEPLDFVLDETTGSRRIGGCAFHAELDNHRARERLFEAIEGARRTVHVQVYMVRPSTFTDHLIVRLVQRARAGVAVRLMVDSLYSDEEVLGRLNEALDSLRDEPNVEVLAIAPIATTEQVTLSRFKKRDHRKLVVVDGELAFVSGRNASDEYYMGFDEVPVHDHTEHDRIPWLDAHVEVRGPLVREVQQTFLETWKEVGGSPIAHDDAVLPTLEEAGDGTGRLVVHRGFADTYGLAMYEAMFASAETQATIVNDYPFVPAIERAILRMLARGVRVRLLTGSAAARRGDGTFFPAPLHRTLFEHMVKGKLEPLLEAGLEAWELVPPPSELVVARGGCFRPYVHAKIVSVDGRVASVGSANLDATASYWESEANVVVQDEAFASDLEAQLQAMIDRSVRLDLQSAEWKRERTQRAVVATLWPDSLYS